ncbi:hypothetical protein GCM10022198_23540 [Klugiella xanthotipulae]|uniref:Uncharacterized protein n=1 Tax=Klugiella xanthotipulae TaxID=244735 RepID=A0A543I626_9MICO|nr:ABC transporter permease [Klugiella xanthotipulae]TQM65920.1 hypothetical protein FB466_0740 [Klugiella xanthotipulae]
MSTPSITHRAETTGAFARILSVVRLQLVNPWTIVIWPWIIMGIIFIANLVIWWILSLSLGPEVIASEASGGGGVEINGGSLYIFIYMMVVAIMAMNLTFSFALGFGATRRDFYLGSALTFVLLSAMYAVALAILAAAEKATDGWGLNGHIFRAVYFGDGGFLANLWIFFVLFLFFFFVGAVIATVFVRWKATGVTILACVVALLLVGVAALIGLTNNWGTFAGFFVHWGFLGSYTWSLVITAIAALAGFFILRRATPRG